MKRYMVLIGVACILLGCGDTTHDAEEPLAVHTQDFADVDTHAQPVPSDNDEEETVQERVEEAMVQEAVRSYADVLDISLERPDDEIARMSNVIRLIYSDAPFLDKARGVWRFWDRSKSYDNVTNVIAHFANTASSLEEKHSAMVIAAFAACRFKEYENGISVMETIIDEQLAQDRPSGHIVGAYQNLSLLYSLSLRFDEGVAAARKAIEWSDQLQSSERRARAGLKSTLAEALAHAGKYEEAEEVLLDMIEEYLDGEVSGYDSFLDRVRFLKAHPERRDFNKPFQAVTY